MSEWTTERIEELEAVIACLGDDAARLKDDNPEDERAANMVRAAELLQHFHPDRLIEAAQAKLRTAGTLTKDEANAYMAQSLFNPTNQVYFRAGLIACREYMARFVEAQSPEIAASIRANWWPQRALTAIGVPFQRRPDGTLLVSRTAFESATNPTETPVERESLAMHESPETAWEETPLGRWQAEWNATRAAIEAPALTDRQKLSLATELARRRREARTALLRFHAAKRRAARLQRTPPWVNFDAIRAVYTEAHRLTSETGIPHHVDHEIPLQGEFVSGLHVHTNLQILTGSENSRKRNRFDIEP